jgi:hypothetical protein
MSTFIWADFPGIYIDNRKLKEGQSAADVHSAYDNWNDLLIQFHR